MTTNSEDMTTAESLAFGNALNAAKKPAPSPDNWRLQHDIRMVLAEALRVSSRSDGAEWDKLNRAQDAILALLAAHYPGAGVLAEYVAELENRIYNHDEGPCDHACSTCVRNAGADDSMVQPGYVCTYHKVLAKRAMAQSAGRDDGRGGAT